VISGCGGGSDTAKSRTIEAIDGQAAAMAKQMKQIDQDLFVSVQINSMDLMMSQLTMKTSIQELSAEKMKAEVVAGIQEDPKLLRVLEEEGYIKHSYSSYETDGFLFEFKSDFG